MAEMITLDPSAVATNRTQVDITSYVDADGVDWGDAAIAAYMADGSIGSSPVDFRIPNRQITIPLNLRDLGATSFAQIRTNIQSKVALFHAEGGWLMRLVNGTPYYADIVDATLHLGGSWLQAYRSIDVDAVLRLECIPDWYGDEVTLSDHVETTNPELIFTEATVNGHYPGRVRLVVDNDQVGQDQHGLIWGFRSRYYDSAVTAALAYEAEALQPLDAAGTFAHSGAAGGTTVRHAALPGAAWCPVLSTNMGTAGTAFLTHRGSYQTWARVYSGTAVPQLRFLWDIGDLTGPTTNDTVQIPTAGNFHIVNLGQIRLDPAPTGTHRWQGVIQAKAATQGDQIEIDKLWFQPLDDGAGRLVAVQQSSVLGINFTLPAGTAADDAAIGVVNWLAPINVLAADNVPTAASVSGVSNPSHWLKATSFGFAIPTGATVSGIQVDVLRRGDGTGRPVVDNAVRLIKAGTIQTPDKADTITPWPDGGYAYKTYGGATDLWSGTWAPADINNANFGFAISATLPSGGSTTRTGYIDYLRMTVYYTTTGGFTTTAEAVVYASRSAELRTEGMYRQDASGTAYAPISSVMGDLPRLPASKLETRTLQVLLKLSRGNFAEEPDAGIDDVSAQIKYRPSYLIVG